MQQTPSLQLLPKSTTSIWGWFTVSSGIPQMQGTSSWLWRFNPLLLRLLGEIFLSLLCSHSSWGSALDLAPPLHVGSPLASVLCPDRMRLRSHWLGGSVSLRLGRREWYGMQGESAAAEAGMRLQQPESCHVFSWGSCPWIMGPWQWQAAQVAGRGGVGSDLCLHTGFLVAAAGALVFHACLGSALIATACTHLWSSFRQCSESPLHTHTETIVSCLSSRSRVFPRLPPGYQPPSGSVHAANPNPLPTIWTPKPEPQFWAPTHPGKLADKLLRLVSFGRHWSSVWESLCFALCTRCCTLLCGSEASPHPMPTPCPHKWRCFLVCGNFSSITSLSQRCRSLPSPFFCLRFFFFILPYPGTWGFSCLLWSLRSSASVQ